jgi:hypothetical protein
VSRRSDTDVKALDIRLALIWMAYGAADFAVVIWAWVHFDFWAAAACLACSILGAKGSDALMALTRQRQDLSNLAALHESVALLNEMQKRDRKRLDEIEFELRDPIAAQAALMGLDPAQYAKGMTRSAH